MKQSIMNSNDQLKEYTCTENYYRHLSGLLYTDGIKALCTQFECYWLLDLICSYQPGLQGEEFQVWSLGVNENESAIVICTDGNDQVLKMQKIHYTNFKAKEATVWVRKCGIAAKRALDQCNSKETKLPSPLFTILYLSIRQPIL